MSEQAPPVTPKPRYKVTIVIESDDNRAATTVVRIPKAVISHEYPGGRFEFDPPQATSDDLMGMVFVPDLDGGDVAYWAWLADAVFCTHDEFGVRSGRRPQDGCPRCVEAGGTPPERFSAAVDALIDPPGPVTYSANEVSR